MRRFCFFTFVFVQLSSFAQIEYTPVLGTTCSNYESEIAWVLTAPSGATYFFDFFEGHTAFDLPDTGTYVLSSYFYEFEPLEVRVSVNKQVDTFFTTCLEIPLIISNPPPTRYRFCGEIAEGYCVDYYQRGIVRREGAFKNGHPIDTVKTYYYSGEIKEFDIPLRGEKKRVYFYQNGNIEREYNSQTNESREYYPSGKLSFYRHYKKRRRTIEKEYYENGQLKRSQKKRKEIRYSLSGRKTDVLRKRLVSGHFSRRYKVFDLNWKSYNHRGKIQSQILFSSYSDYPAYPEDKLSIERSTIRKALLFEKGRAVKKVVVNYEYVNKELVHRTTTFEKVNNKWVKKRLGTLYHLHEFL